MAVSSTTSTITYTGNNSSSTAYVIPFYFLQNADIEVVLIDPDLSESVLNLTSEYTLNGEGEEAGGDVTTVAAYDNTYKIRITRKPDFLQQYVLEEGNLNVMKTLEKGMDNLVMQLQRLDAETTTALAGKASNDGAIAVLNGAGTPAATATLPTYIGQHYVDTTNSAVWHSTGTTSTSDWELHKPSTNVIVTKAADLSGTLDSTVAYVIDGIIDMGSQSIEIPAGGLTIMGSSFDVTQLTSSENNYSMFTSPAGGSGNLLLQDVGLTASGTSSKVFEITDATGFNAFEISRVNFNNCTSLGEITNYRQGFETGTGRFGGTPNLTLTGTWVGGYFIESSIVRSVSASMTGALFQAGAGFSMSSRFRSNQNIDLPASAAFLDFAPSNFPNPSTLQLQGCIVTRDGATNPDDSNITPNITRSDLASAWKDNIGMTNTFVGGALSVVSESATSISVADQWETLNAGTWLATDLEHFDQPAAGQLRHLGKSPREFEVSANVVVEGGANDTIAIKLRKWDDSASAFLELDYTALTRVVNNLQGARDVAYFTQFTGVTLDQNDYIYLQVKNITDTSNVTAELGSFFRIQER